MTLAQRVRDCRYAKGWGPDELASRAAISRTALYQIESGKTEQPRAGTLRRIAEALSVPTEALLGPQSGLGTVSVPWSGEMTPTAAPRTALENNAEAESIRFTPFSSPFGGWAGARERDIERKFVELLRTPLGEGLARIVEESYRLLPARVEAIR
ncbi:MAG TPA: helix-turn-helix transcriptional regulator [Isosphaeraceae bacterium]|jgi:transcriptional regulator with XRE-family HTH domain